MKRRHTLVPALVAVGVLGSLSVAPAAAHGPDFSGRPLVVAMTGAAERPGPGDQDGSGTATFRLNPGQQQICYTLEVSGIAPATAAHIHLAGPDVAGPVVVALAAPTSGTSSGCAEVDRSMVLAILQDPAAYYVNVHNAEHPAGAVRGQLG